jgi:hypothetical protein
MTPLPPPYLHVRGPHPLVCCCLAIWLVLTPVPHARACFTSTSLISCCSAINHVPRLARCCCRVHCSVTTPSAHLCTTCRALGWQVRLLDHGSALCTCTWLWKRNLASSLPPPLPFPESPIPPPAYPLTLLAGLLLIPVPRHMAVPSRGLRVARVVLLSRLCENLCLAHPTPPQPLPWYPHPSSCHSCASPLVSQSDNRTVHEVVNVAAVCQMCPTAYCKSCFFSGRVDRTGTNPPRSVAPGGLATCWAWAFSSGFQ